MNRTVPDDGVVDELGIEIRHVEQRTNGAERDERVD